VGLLTIHTHKESYFLAAVFMYDVNFKNSLLKQTVVRGRCVGTVSLRTKD